MSVDFVSSPMFIKRIPAEVSDGGFATLYP